MNSETANETRQAGPDAARATATRAPYGAHAPSRLVRALLWATRNTPLGRGRARQALRGIMTRLSGGVIDGTFLGQRVRCRLDDNRAEWKAFLRPRAFDPAERAAIARRLDRASAVFVDIGANVGFHSLAAAASAWPDARIIAFEPHPETFLRLAFNLALSTHRGIVAVEVALGDNDGWATLAGDDLSLASLAVAGTGPSVRVRPLVDCLAELAIDHIDALKIDVEGWEDHVLMPFLEQAAPTLLPSFVVIEHLGRAHWKQDCIAAMIARGYVVVGRDGNNTFLER